MKKIILTAAVFILSCSPPEPYDSVAGAMPAGFSLSASHETVESGMPFTVTPVILYDDGSQKVLSMDEIDWQAEGSGTAVYDAAGLFAAAAPGVCVIRAGYAQFTAQTSVTITAKIDLSGLKLSRILYDAKGSDTGKEFVTIENRLSVPVSIAGAAIEFGSYRYCFAEGVSIPGGTALTVAQNRTVFETEYGSVPEFDLLPGSIRNSGETVVLAAPDGSVLDRVYIEGGSTELPAPAEWGSSASPAAAEGKMIVRNPGDDTDTFADWGEK